MNVEDDCLLDVINPFTPCHVQPVIYHMGNQQVNQYSKLLPPLWHHQESQRHNNLVTVLESNHHLSAQLRDDSCGFQV